MAYEDQYKLIGKMSVREDGNTIYFGANSPETAQQAFDDVTQGKTPDMIGKLSLDGNQIALDVAGCNDLAVEVSKTIIALKIVDQLNRELDLIGDEAVRLAIHIQANNQGAYRDYEVKLRDLSSAKPAMEIGALAPRHLVYNR